MPHLLRLLLALAGAAPWLLALLGKPGLTLQPVFHSFCHQIPERTLSVMGNPMVVCSRCAGIYGGVALAALMPTMPFLIRRGRTWVIVALVVMVLDVLLQDLGAHAPSHPLRLATGFLVGWTAAAFLFAALAPVKPAQTAS